MGFRDLISRTLSGEANPPSHYDEEFVVATTKKIYKALNPLDNENPLRNSINSISENSQYTKLRNHVIITALNFVNASSQSAIKNIIEQNFVTLNVFPRISQAPILLKSFYQIQPLFIF